MIVHIITGLARGGAETALYRLLTQEKDPARVRVISLSDKGVLGAEVAALGIDLTCLHLGSRVPSPRKFFQLVRLLRKMQPDLVQTWLPHSDLIGGLAARLAGVPVCWGIRHAHLPSKRTKSSVLVVLRLCALLSRWIPAKIIANSQRGADVHRALGFAAPIVVVPNGLDIAAWRSDRELRPALRAGLDLPDDAFVFAHAGRDDPLKDHEGLAEAFSLAHARHSRAWLLLCGRGLRDQDPYFEALPFSAAAKGHVLPLGPRDDLADLWQAADAFVLSSVTEGFPNVVVEAMACGLPCVVTDVGDAADIVGDTGLVVPPEQPSLLAEAMVRMIELPAIDAARLSATSRQRVEERFSLEKMADAFHRIWAEIMLETND